MDYTKEMETACEVLQDQMGDLVRKIKNSGMSSGDLDNMEKLTHSLASVKKVMKMSEEDGYSGMYPYMGGYGYDGGNGGSYRDGNRGGSYARGNQRRDSMGRYSRERGYSRNDLADKMRELMEDAPDERTRQEMQRMIEKLDNA